MQRYDPIDFGNGCLPDELMEHSLDGRYVLSEEAQAEIDALNAECDRLKAQMLEDIKSLRNSLAESGRVHEDMKLGGNKMAESLRFAKASVEDLEAENSQLKAEIDKLTALMEKPKVLEAHELTEPGWYWHKWPLQKEWKIVKVHHIGQAAGQFIGPIKTPEAA